MTSRERARLTLNHKQPDRPPIEIGGSVTSLTYKAYNEYMKYFNIESNDAKIGGFKVMKDVDEELIKIFHSDFRCINFNPTSEQWHSKKLTDNTFVNAWGITFRDVGEYTEMIDQPLKNADISDLDKFPWPDFSKKEDYAGLREHAKWMHENTEYCLIGRNGVNVLENAQWVRGLSEFLMDMYTDEAFTHKLLDITLELELEYLEHYLDEVGEYIDIFCYGDDLAMQSAPFFSVEKYREFLKPRHKQVYEMVKKKSNAKIFHHTCGAVYPLIGEMIDIGLDILNPVQTSAEGMDIVKLKQEFGKDLVFWGAVDEQYLLPFGSKQEIRDAVKRNIEILGKDGGYVVAPAHNVQSDVPPENLLEMVNAVLDM